MNRRHILSLSTIAALGLALLPGSAVSQQKSPMNQLVGNSTLVPFENTAADGTKRRLYAANPSSAMAQDKAMAEKGKPTTKVLFNNDKVLVVEVTYKPDVESKSRIRPVYRVVRALKSGTLQRIYADGKTENWAMKAGEVKVYEADKKPFATKNVGTSDLIFYVVALKKPKK